MSGKRLLNPNKYIFLVALLLVVVIICVYTVSRKEYSISLELGSRKDDYLNYNNKALIIKGYVIKLPFNLSFTQGKATIADEVWGFKDYYGIGMPEVETLYFRPNGVYNKILALKIHYFVDGSIEYTVKITHKENSVIYEAIPHN